MAYDFDVYNAKKIIIRLLNETVSAFKLKHESFEIVGELSGEIVLDQRAIRIVINNPIDNAIKYSQKKVHISVKMLQTSKKYIIDFCDLGIGLRNKDQKIIFKKFERINEPDSPNVKGTGLGLYWVREIINGHGGKITVSSAGRGRGTTFRIELPIYQSSKIRFTNRLLKLTSRRKLEDENADE